MIGKRYLLYFCLLSSEQKQPIFIVKVGFGVFAGAIASYLATPSEVALIRFDL